MLTAYFALVGSFFTLLGAILNVPWFRSTTDPESIPIYLGTYVLLTSVFFLFTLFMLRLLRRKGR